MKALYCGKCGDFKALQNDIVACECGRVRGRWFDGARGLALISEVWTVGGELVDIAEAAAPEGSYDPENSYLPIYAWVLGVHNGILNGAHNLNRTNQDRGDVATSAHYRLWQTAEGTLFKRCQSMIVRFRPGESSDTRFVPLVALIEREWPS